MKKRTLDEQGIDKTRLRLVPLQNALSTRTNNFSTFMEWSLLRPSIKNYYFYVSYSGRNLIFTICDLYML